MGAWGFVKSLFATSSKDILDKDNGLLSQVGGWIGNYQFTEEERAEANSKLSAAVIDYAKATLNESTDRSQTRRILSIEIMRVELFLILASVIIHPWSPEYAKFIWMVASSALMAGAFGAVIVFFFGAYGWGAHIKKKSE